MRLAARISEMRKKGGSVNTENHPKEGLKSQEAKPQDVWRPGSSLEPGAEGAKKEGRLRSQEVTRRQKKRKGGLLWPNELKEEPKEKEGAI